MERDSGGQEAASKGGSPGMRLVTLKESVQSPLQMSQILNQRSPSMGRLQSLIDVKNRDHLKSLLSKSPSLDGLDHRNSGSNKRLKVELKPLKRNHQFNFKFIPVDPKQHLPYNDSINELAQEDTSINYQAHFKSSNKKRSVGDVQR